MDEGRPASSTVLAEDARARVELLELDGRPVVRKTYKSPAHLRWRTLFRRSRAQREFENLSALRAAGLPCVVPIRWSEDRSAGALASSTLVTSYLGDTRDLHAVIRTERAGRRRDALARAFGRLLRAMHEAGFCSTTASPRNFLVLPADGELVIIDQPHLVRLDPGRLLRRLAQCDLYDAFFSPRRLEEWSKTERWRGLSAYCKDDRRAARAAWTRLAGRWRWTLRLDRDLARTLGHLRRIRTSTTKT